MAAASGPSRDMDRSPTRTTGMRLLVSIGAVALVDKDSGLEGAPSEFERIL